MIVETTEFKIDNPRYEFLTSKEIRTDRSPPERALGALIVLDVTCKTCNRAWCAHRGDGLQQSINHVNLRCRCGTAEHVSMDMVRKTELG